jgi:phosphatidylserine/phosphatidylglycerophosphate/cardiolipin synthase-like enzyme
LALRCRSSRKEESISSLILKRAGKAYKVLAGSANFSVRGLYVQANNVFVYDDPAVAALYSQAFDEAWANAAGFARSTVAAKYFPFSGAGIPTGRVAFSPHKAAAVSLKDVASAIRGARSSLLFAVMELGGGGDVLASLRNAYTRKDVLSLGVTQALGADGTQKGAKVFTASSSGILVPFAALDKNVPQPFRKEWSGGMGQVIHDKFVVVDFNDADPVVFAGSSNLAEGGEESNGDNLVATTDRLVVSLYAVEAIRLVDHYAFRAALRGAKSASPLALQGPGAKAPWWAPYYDPKSRKYRERTLLAR